MKTLHCNEKQNRFEVEYLDDTMFVRLYDNEQKEPRERLEYYSDREDTDEDFTYSYTIYEAYGNFPPDVFTEDADKWADYIKELDKKKAAKEVRKTRNELLRESDWATLPDAKTDKTACKAYRQALRDISEQAGFPYEIEWPEKPEDLQ